MTYVVKNLNMMSKSRLVGSCEVTINCALKRLSKLDGKNHEALKSEFREWINAIESQYKNYEILYLNKIN